MNRVLVLGENEKRYGEFSAEVVDTGLCGFLSVGSDSLSASMRYKGSIDAPNEDGFLVLSDEQHILIAVADSHFGCRASHELLRRLSIRSSRIPVSRGQLALLALGLTEPAWEDDSATTLVVVVVDKATREGFGYSWGDSSLVCLGERGVRMINVPDSQFLAAGVPPEMEKSSFRFSVDSHEILLAYTDGVNECSYRQPENSVGPEHLMLLFRSFGHDCERFGRELMHLALKGVGGASGGQDNIALVVSSF